MVIVQILKMVVVPAAEAKVGALYHTARETFPLWMVAKLGHLQLATPIHTNNTTTSDIMNETIKQRHSKAIDIRFYWLKDRVSQKMFRV